MVKSYLIVGETGSVLVDTGVPDSEAAIFEKLTVLGVTFTEIKLIVLTHGHWDHIGSAHAIKARTSAPLAGHYREKNWVETGQTPAPPGLNLKGKIMMALMKLAPERNIPGTPVDIVLTEDGLDLSSYGLAGRIVHTPGHTSGSVSVVLENGAAFVGDLAMSAKFLRLTPGLPIFGDDIATIHQSWQALLDFGAETIYPAHGPVFSADVFRKAVG